MSEERWRLVPEWPDYEISDHGRFRRATPGHGSRAGYVFANYRCPTTGYPVVTPRRDGCEQGRCYIHRLVAEAFIGKAPSEGMEVNHRDGDKSNNHVSNLEWVTPAENHAHATQHGLKARGEQVGTSKLSEADVLMIRELYDAGGITQKELADRFEVVPGTIAFILRGETWRHLLPAEVV